MSFFFVYDSVQIKNSSGNFLDVPPILLAVVGDLRTFHFWQEKKLSISYRAFESFEEASQYAEQENSGLFAYPIFEAEGEDKGIDFSCDIKLLSASLAHAYPNDSKYAKRIDLSKVRLNLLELDKIFRIFQRKKRESKELTQEEIDTCLKRKYNFILGKDNSFMSQLMDVAMTALYGSAALFWGVKLLKKNRGSFFIAVLDFLIASSSLVVSILSANRFFLSRQSQSSTISSMEKFEQLADELYKEKLFPGIIKMISYLNMRVEKDLMRKDNNFLPLAIHKLEKAKQKGNRYIDDFCFKIEGKKILQVKDLPSSSSSSWFSAR